MGGRFIGEDEAALGGVRNADGGGREPADHGGTTNLIVIETQSHLHGRGVYLNLPALPRGILHPEMALVVLARAALAAGPAADRIDPPAAVGALAP